MSIISVFQSVASNVQTVASNVSSLYQKSANDESVLNTYDFYVKSYLKYRDVFQQILKENKTKEEEIAAENAFLGLDFSSIDLYHSGMVKDFFEAYFKQLFKLGNKELIVKKMNTFSELIKGKIQSKPIILNNYVEYLVKQYEKYGLVEVAEHLALALLDDNKCRMDAKTLPLLEQYKKMAIGNIVPHVVFSNQLKYKSSADINAKYKVIVFGASWCEECKAELPQFKEYAEIFKTKYDTEIIFVSIDTKEEEFKNFTKDFPFVSTCDLEGWDGGNVKNYYVFATPSIYVLDIENKIVAKPSNAINTSRWFFDHVKQ
jgi:thiol-disulfide isomerase/thioredoxin